MIQIHREAVASAVSRLFKNWENMLISITLNMRVTCRIAVRDPGEFVINWRNGAGLLTYLCQLLNVVTG